MREKKGEEIGLKINYNESRFMETHSYLSKTMILIRPPVVLGWRQCAERAVEHSPRARYLLLLGEELAVVHPDARHLVHEDEAALEAVVDLVVARVRDAPPLDLLPPNLARNRAR